MELPQPKPLFGRRADRRAQGTAEDRGDRGAMGCGTNIDSCGGTRVRRRPALRPPPLPPPVRPGSKVTAAPHPATFSDVRYKRSWHRPGLRFFEYIPSRVPINMASTLVFVDSHAAKRVRMRKLWAKLTRLVGRMRRLKISLYDGVFSWRAMFVYCTTRVNRLIEISTLAL